MSKPSSHIFYNTVGYRKSFNYFKEQIELIIQTSKNKYDFREHPRANKQLTTKQRSKLISQVKSRSISKSDWKKLNSDSRFRERRKRGIINFWNSEKVRLLCGQRGTREWNNQQVHDILSNQRPKYNGKTIQGHHIYSAAKYPHLADKGDLIYPVTFDEHLYGWHGGNFRNSLPGRPINYKKKHSFKGGKK